MPPSPYRPGKALSKPPAISLRSSSRRSSSRLLPRRTLTEEKDEASEDMELGSAAFVVGVSDPRHGRGGIQRLFGYPGRARYAFEKIAALLREEFGHEHIEN